MSCLVLEVKGTQVLRTQNWTQNWFSSKTRSICTLVRATLAFGLFPLTLFLSSRRLDFRTSFNTLNSLLFNLCRILCEKEDIVSRLYSSCPYSLRSHKNCAGDCPTLKGAYFTQFSDLNISETNANICTRETAFLCDTPKKSRDTIFLQYHFWRMTFFLLL